jgi:prepilin-type N-terminal cleavage/methylation domain-containing protein
MKRHGFSLIELMVVVGIIAFLATIAVPSFTRFLAKAKRSEAYMNLNAIYAAQKAHWIEHGTYTDVLQGEGGIGWKSEGNCYYSYGFPGAAGRNYFVGKLGSTQGLQHGSASKDAFVAVAVGDIDNDGKMDVITVDQNNTIIIVEDDLL